MPPRNQPPGNQQGDVRQAARARREERAADGTDQPDPGTSLALRPDQTRFDAVQIAALGQLGVKDATTEDLIIYADFCLRTGLNPFAKQVYMLPRRQWNAYLERYEVKQTIQVGIDGFRLIRDRAERDGGFSCEFEETVWYDKNLTEYGVWVQDEPPAACKVVMVKIMSDGTRLRFPAVLTFSAYVPRKAGKINPTGRWVDDPAHQIEKCCEAFASRRGCPQELSGVYLAEEMDGTTEPPGPGRAPRNGRSRRKAPAGPVVAQVLKDGVPQGEGPPPDPAGPDGDLEPRRKAAVGGIMAIFSEHGLGGPDSHDVRVNAIAALARDKPDDDPLDPQATTTLDALKAERTLDELRRFVKAAREDEAQQGDPREALTKLAGAVMQWREQQAAGAKS